MHSEEYKLLAKHLLQARVRAGLSQREVAARLHKPPSFPHKIEYGERELNVIELLDYCEALGIDFVQFAAEIAQAVREMRGATPAPTTSDTSPPSSPAS